MSLTRKPLQDILAAVGGAQASDFGPDAIVSEAQQAAFDLAEKRAKARKWLAYQNAKNAAPVEMMETPAVLTRELAASLTGTLVPWTSDKFTYSGAHWVLAGAAFPDNLFCVATRGTPYSGMLGSGDVSFLYYGQSLEIYVKEFLGTGFLVYVDGKLSSATLKTTATAPGELTFYLVDFGSVALRSVKIEMNGQFYFGGIIPENENRSVYKTPTTAKNRLICMGDSYTQGDNAADYLRGYARTLGKIFDVDSWASGIGGLGYLTGGGGGQTIRSRLATDLYPFNPDMVILAAGHNDNGFNAAQIEAELGLILDGIAENLPNAQVFVVGPIVESAALAADANYIGVRNGLSAACVARGVSFFDPLTDPWFTGQRTVTAGNASDFVSADNVHPSNAGHAYLAQRIAAKMAEVLAEI